MLLGLATIALRATTCLQAHATNGDVLEAVIAVQDAKTATKVHVKFVIPDSRTTTVDVRMPRRPLKMH
jgi:hypothetical protein